MVSIKRNNFFIRNPTIRIKHDDSMRELYSWYKFKFENMKRKPM